jgi:hypothetical protein
VETERAAVIPPQSLDDFSSLRLPIAIRRTPLLRLACLSEFPHRPSAVLVWRSRLVALTTPRCSVRWGRRARIRTDVPPSGLAPLQSMTRVAAHRRARSHEVSAPSAQPSRRDPPLPGPYPARVTLRPHAYHAPRRFTPSTASLVSFNQARSRGSPCRA